MPRTALVKVAAPLMGISVLLFGLGVVAAWNVHRQQVTTSEVVAREVEAMFTTFDFYVVMREIRHVLNQYLRNGDSELLNGVPEMKARSLVLLQKMRDLARTDEEREHVSITSQGVDTFFHAYDPVARAGTFSANRVMLESLVDRVLTDEVLEPARRCVDQNRIVVNQANEANRHTSDQLRQGFLLLGITGGGAGVIIGLAIARSLEQSFLELHLSFTGAAGKLHDVVGPFPVPNYGGLGELSAGLRDIEVHVEEVVSRLRAREIEVLHNEQLAAVGQLAAGVAHELRNPLMPMKMLVDAALDRDDGKGLNDRQLQVMRAEIGRLEESIQAFLDFARPPVLETRTFDLKSVVEQTLELVSSRADQQHVELHDDAPPGNCMIEADAAQLRQVILNLLLNALDELKEGGAIRVQLRAAPLPDMGWEVTIRDNGPGFPPENLARVFEPFVTTKDTGTGLGLSICRRIVDAHGGRIEADNSPEGGAVFRIFFPAQRRTVAVIASTANHA